MFTLSFDHSELVLDSPQIMGILNLTPDSFSDGGKYSSVEASLKHTLAMVEQGADIIDVGGESTRPGAALVSEQQELQRVIPVIEKIRQHTSIPISVDTSKPEVMKQAIAAGANIINDVRALRTPGALAVAAELDVPVCLMHMQGQPQTMQDNPQYIDIVEEVISELHTLVNRAVRAGIKKHNLMIDPGFGFGKTLQDNYVMLSRLTDFHRLGLPLLVGMSRKSMIGNLINKPAEQRLSASLACATIAAEKGAHIIRVHDVEQTKDAIRIVKAIKSESKR